MYSEGVVYEGEQPMLSGPLITMAWRVLRLRVIRRPPDTEGSC